MFMPKGWGDRGLQKPGLFRLLLLQARLIDQKKRRAINLKKRKGTEVYLLEGGEVEGLWVSKKVKIII